MLSLNQSKKRLAAIDGQRMAYWAHQWVMDSNPQLVQTHKTMCESRAFHTKKAMKHMGITDQDQLYS